MICVQVAHRHLCKAGVEASPARHWPLAPHRACQPLAILSRLQSLLFISHQLLII